MQAHRVVFAGSGAGAVEACEVAAPGPGEILVRTQVSLLSPGTEGAGLMALSNTPATFPKRPGYSNVGAVQEAGADVQDLEPGDLVASHTAHASYVVVKAEQAARVPEGLPPEQAAFSTLAAISMQAVRKARVELGESVLVLGLGLVGNQAQQLARLQDGKAARGPGHPLLDWREAV